MMQTKSENKAFGYSMGKLWVGYLNPLLHNGFTAFQTNCKSVVSDFGGSNPPSSTIRENPCTRVGTGVFLCLSM